MTQLYAQPYDLSATGFYFETSEEYAIKSAALRNDYGESVEEFEIQFIDGDETDCDLAKAIGLNQVNFAQFLSAVDNWDDGEKRTVIIAVGECGYAFETDLDPSQFEIDIYEIASMRDLAEQFVEEGMFGEVPKAFQTYIDYDAIARDLAVEYSETVIAGVNYIYSCR